MAFGLEDLSQVKPRIYPNSVPSFSTYINKTCNKLIRLKFVQLFLCLSSWQQKVTFPVVLIKSSTTLDELFFRRLEHYSSREK